MEWNNKVSALAGLDAAFPFLDRDLLAFLMAVPGEIHNKNGVPRALLREAMKGILPEAVRARVWKADFSVTVNQGLIRDFEQIARALSPEAAAVQRGYLLGDRIAEEVKALERGLNRADCFDSWDLADMFGLEVWLRVFFGANRGVLHD
jgi:asparagine synthase (glutamine-hydrolysing)